MTDVSDVLLFTGGSTVIAAPFVPAEVLVIDDPEGLREIVVFDTAPTVGGAVATTGADFVLLDTLSPPVLTVAETGAEVLVITSGGPSGPPGVDGRQGIDGLPGAAGAVGATGPPGASSAFYVHLQDVAALHWDVYHDLGYPPNVTVVDSLGDVVFGDVQILDPAHLVIDFTAAFSGYAYLS